MIPGISVPFSSGGGPISALNDDIRSRASTRFGRLSGGVVNLGKSDWQDVAKWGLIALAVVAAVKALKR